LSLCEAKIRGVMSGVNDFEVCCPDS
jgi:hypothetical protein